MSESRVRFRVRFRVRARGCTYLLDQLLNLLRDGLRGGFNKALLPLVNQLVQLFHLFRDDLFGDGALLLQLLQYERDLREELVYLI